MFQKFEGLKTTLWTGLIVAIVFFAISNSQVFWQGKVALIEQVIYILFAVGIIFSAQFGRSRFTLLITLWTLYYLVQYQLLPGKAWLNDQQDWLFLSGILCFALLTVVKDRGILSIHGVLRVVSIVVCIVLAKGWLLLVQWWLDYSQTNGVTFAHFDELSTHVPLYLATLFVFYKSLRQPNLLVSSLLTSLVVWTLLHSQYLTFPLSMTFSLLTLHYILVVVIDSYFLAYRDELTKIPSRRALNQYALSLGGKYSVAMLDIDHFKKFNDNYGHDIGDQVLKLVAAKMAQVKGGGRVFRYGGEEFMVIFPRKDANESSMTLEQLRQTIADYKIVIRHPLRKNKKARKGSDVDGFKTVNVTISIGVATRENKTSFEQTVKSADEALYRAKKNGRNNVSY